MNRVCSFALALWGVAFLASASPAFADSFRFNGLSTGTEYLNLYIIDADTGEVPYLLSSTGGLSGFDYRLSTGVGNGDLRIKGEYQFTLHRYDEQSQRTVGELANGSAKFEIDWEGTKFRRDPVTGREYYTTTTGSDPEQNGINDSSEGRLRLDFHGNVDQLREDKIRVDIFGKYQDPLQLDPGNQARFAHHLSDQTETFFDWDLRGGDRSIHPDYSHAFNAWLMSSEFFIDDQRYFLAGDLFSPLTLRGGPRGEVPEPASVALLSFALAGVFMKRKQNG